MSKWRLSELFNDVRNARERSRSDRMKLFERPGREVELASWLATRNPFEEIRQLWLVIVLQYKACIRRKSARVLTKYYLAWVDHMANENGNHLNFFFFES